MKALLWKDFHVNRFVLIAGAALLLFPYVVTAIATLADYWHRSASDNITWQVAVDQWRWMLPHVAVFSLILSVLTIAVLGGNAVAGERADRSAEFLASMPVRRSRIILSKAALAIGVAALIWLVNLLIIYVPELPEGTPQQVAASMDEGIRDVATVAGIACLVFGVAWFFSVCLASPAFATSAGLAAPIVLYIGWEIVAEFLPGSRWHASANSAFPPICVLLGITGFVAGTISYVRRSEP